MCTPRLLKSTFFAQVLGSFKADAIACFLSSFVFTTMCRIFTDHQSKLINLIKNPICGHPFTRSKEEYECHLEHCAKCLYAFCSLFKWGCLPDKHVALFASPDPTVRPYRSRVWKTWANMKLASIQLFIPLRYVLQFGPVFIEPNNNEKPS